MISFPNINMYGLIAGPGPKGSEPADTAAQIEALKQKIRTSSADDPYNIYFEFSQAISQCEKYAKSDKKGAVELFDHLGTAAASIKDKDTAARFLKSLADRIPGLELGKAETNNLLASILVRAKTMPPLQEASGICRVAAVQAAHKLIGKAESDKALSGALVQVRTTTVNKYSSDYNPMDMVRKALVLVEIAEAMPKGIKEKSKLFLLYDEAMRTVEEMAPIMSYKGHAITAEESFKVKDAVEDFDKKVIGSMTRAGFKKDEIARLFMGRQVGMDATKVSDYLRTH